MDGVISLKSAVCSFFKTRWSNWPTKRLIITSLGHRSSYQQPIAILLTKQNSVDIDEESIAH